LREGAVPDSVLQFLDVSFAYSTGSAPALRGVSLALEPGQLLAVVGANGSGKSTLARLCDGLLTPSSGRVLVDGLDTADEPLVWDVRARVGMVFQDPDDQIVGTMVEEDCAFGPENLGLPPAEIVARVASSLAAVGLTGLERREPHLLSEGQKQRLAIAGALAMGPRYLVFDEPTAMLDPAGRRSAIATIEQLAHEEGHGVLLISHDAADVARADRVLALSAGKVVFEGSPEALLADAGLLRTCGLATGTMGALGDRLRALGLPVPVTALEAESVVAALWP
jgi:energy-coupling factor transport system ATP-binding protein